MSNVMRIAVVMITFTFSCWSCEYYCEEKNWPLCRKISAASTCSLTGLGCIEKGASMCGYMSANSYMGKNACTNMDWAWFPTHYYNLSACDSRFCEETAITWTISLCLITNCMLCSSIVAPCWEKIDNRFQCTCNVFKNCSPWRRN